MTAAQEEVPTIEEVSSEEKKDHRNRCVLDFMTSKQFSSLLLRQTVRWQKHSNTLLTHHFIMTLFPFLATQINKALQRPLYETNRPRRNSY